MAALPPGQQEGTPVLQLALLSRNHLCVTAPGPCGQGTVCRLHLRLLGRKGHMTGILSRVRTPGKHLPYTLGLNILTAKMAVLVPARGPVLQRLIQRTLASDDSTSRFPDPASALKNPTRAWGMQPASLTIILR